MTSGRWWSCWSCSVCARSGSSSRSRSGARRYGRVSGDWSAEPASAAEQDEKSEDCDDLQADAEHPERPGLHAEVIDEDVEVLSEESGEEAERQKNGGDDRQLFHDHV